MAGEAQPLRVIVAHRKPSRVSIRESRIDADVDDGPPWGIDPSFPAPTTPGEYRVGTVIVQPETGLSVVAAKRRLVRACHIEYTEDEWQAVIANRWHEAIDLRERVAYRCSNVLAKQEGAILRRAGVYVRLLYTGVMEEHELRGI